MYHHGSERPLPARFFLLFTDFAEPEGEGSVRTETITGSRQLPRPVGSLMPEQRPAAGCTCCHCATCVNAILKIRRRRRPPVPLAVRPGTVAVHVALHEEEAPARAQLEPSVFQRPGCTCCHCATCVNAILKIRRRRRPSVTVWPAEGAPAAYLGLAVHEDSEEEAPVAAEPEPEAPWSPGILAAAEPEAELEAPWGPVLAPCPGVPAPPKEVPMHGDMQALQLLQAMQALAVHLPDWKGTSWWARWSRAQERSERWENEGQPQNPEELAAMRDEFMATYNAPWHSSADAAPRVVVSFAGNVRRANARSLEEQRIAGRSQELLHRHMHAFGAHEWTQDPEMKRFLGENFKEEAGDCLGCSILAWIPCK